MARSFSLPARSAILPRPSDGSGRKLLSRPRRWESTSAHARARTLRTAAPRPAPRRTRCAAGDRWRSEPRDSRPVLGPAAVSSLTGGPRVPDPLQLDRQSPVDLELPVLRDVVVLEIEEVVHPAGEAKGRAGQQREPALGHRAAGLGKTERRSVHAAGEEMQRESGPDVRIPVVRVEAPAGVDPEGRVLAHGLDVVGLDGIAVAPVLD